MDRLIHAFLLGAQLPAPDSHPALKIVWLIRCKMNEWRIRKRVAFRLLPRFRGEPETEA